MKKYSKNDILKFIYGEMSSPEQDAFLDALCTDEALFQEFEAIKEGHEQLLAVNLSPSTNSIDRILHVAGNTARRRNLRPVQGRKTFGFSQIVSTGMVFATCFILGIAIYIYKKDTTPTNNWASSKDALEFNNHSLDQRLDFARHRLEKIINNKTSAPMPVHHDTYRLVQTDPASGQSQSVVLLNIK